MIIVPSRWRAAQAQQIQNVLGACGFQAKVMALKLIKTDKQVSSTTPQLYVGTSKPVKQVLVTTPVVFSEHGATLSMSGRTAIIVCAWPDDMDAADARAKGFALAKEIEAMSDGVNAESLANRVPEPRASSDTSGSLSKWSGLSPTKAFFTQRDIRDRYVDLLYLYAGVRFATEYADRFATR